MQINISVIQAAASSQLGRLELRNIDGDQTCVCNKSFSGWVVHVFRYKFSKNYRAQEQETRRQILTAALGNGSEPFTLSEVQQNSLLDRRQFNRYINTELKRLASANTTGRDKPGVIPPSGSTQTSQADETPAQATNEEPTLDKEPGVISTSTSAQNTKADETSAQATNEEPTLDKESGVISTSTSAQNTKADETPTQATNEEPIPDKEPNATLLDTSAQNTQADETPTQATNEEPKLDKEPGVIPPSTSAQNTEADETPAQATNEEPIPDKEPNATLLDTSAQNTEADETPAQATNEEPKLDKEPGVIPPSTSAQNTEADETLTQATNEEPKLDKEPGVIPPSGSTQTSQADETPAQATNVVSKPDQPSITSEKRSGGDKILPETKKNTQRSSLSRPTASSQSRTTQKAASKKASNETLKPKGIPIYRTTHALDRQHQKDNRAAGGKLQPTSERKLGKASNEALRPTGKAIYRTTHALDSQHQKDNRDAGGKLQPTSERNPIQGRTRQTSSTEKAKPQKATSNRTRTSTPIPTTRKISADSRPITTETITVNYEDTMSNSDNQTWIRKRDLWARDHLTEDHVAAVFYVGDDSGEILHNIAISEIRRECVPTVATLEKRIGERLEQYNPDANANTKHFLTYLTLRNDRVPEERGRLFETEDMKKSSPTAIWRDSFSAGGILGIPPNVTECGRRLPTEALMFCANKIISKLPVETKTGVFRGDEGSEAYSLVAEMYESSSDPEYRKEFSPNGQELAEKDFEWLLEYVASFGSFCNQ